MNNARILVVDDQEPNVRLLEKILQPAGYTNVRSVRDSRQAVGAFREFRPDLILLDLHMPHLDGFGVLRQLAPLIPEGDYLPIIVLSADILPEAKKKALSMGAKDFLTKPFDAQEVLLRIHNLLEVRFLYVDLQKYNESLDAKVRERTRELESAQVEMLQRLARASECRDDDTGQHTQRVGDLAAALALAAGLSAEESDLIRQAAALHDIGKIGVPDQILLKPGKLTPEEFQRMKGHTEIGAKILSSSRFPLIQLAEQIALYHHERWDGGGYYGVSGEAIPLAARIVTIADVFDVLTHARPYKQAWSREDAEQEIRNHRGRLFDPRLARIFLAQCQASLLNLKEAVSAGQSEPDTEKIDAAPSTEAISVDRTPAAHSDT
jgi:putative two-component system response regulator